MQDLRVVRPSALMILALAIASSACALTGGASPTSTPVPQPPPTIGSPVDQPTPTNATPVGSPEAEPSQTPASTATSVAIVRVVATGGNLTLRRGPATAYNVMNYMLKDQSAVAIARNQAADWLLVQDPAGGGRTAWVTAASRYAVVDGGGEAVQALPVETVDPAVPAYIRNCTFHPMRIMPADLILKEMFDAPNNMHAFNPGVYEAYDQNQEGYPKVMSEELREGETIDIEKDGLGNTYLCPA